MAMNRSTTGTLIAGVTLNSRYRIVEMIGEGSFGAVYKAIDERFRSKPVVALKEMSDFQLNPDEKTKALQNFHNEADLLVQLKHPNLPKVSDVFEEDGKAYLVMEFIEGKTLAKIQEEQNDPLDEHLVMSWALKLCAVLHYLHTQPQPIIFRDMKPTNVMVTAEGEIKLIDFGIARVFKATITKDTTLLGSHGYAPLEQYGRGQSDARSDIYALGATLYELLTKELPADSPSRRANPSIFSRPRQLNPNISPAVEAIVLKAMAEEPQNRYPTVADMFNEIVATGLASSAFSIMPTSRSISGPTSHPTTSPMSASEQADTNLATSDQLQSSTGEVTNAGDQGVRTGRAQSSQQSSGQVVSPPNAPVSPPQSRGASGFVRKIVIAIITAVVIFGLVLGSIIFFVLKPTPPTTLCLATDLPTSGSAGTTGRDLRNAVDLALIQNPWGKEYHGYKLKMHYMDDASPANGGSPDPATGVRNIHDLFQQTACPNPIAIIGPYDSSVAAAEIPVAAQKHILLLSSSATAPCLTQKKFSDPATCNYDSMHPQGLSNTYAHIAGDDTVRGYLMADFLLAPPDPNNPGQGGLGAKKIIIVGDGAIAGTQLSQIVIEALRNREVTPIGIYCVKPSQEYNKDHSCSPLKPDTEAFSMENIAELAVKIRDQQPDAILFGGRPDRGAGLLRKHLGELGLDQIPFLGAGPFLAIKDTFLQTMGSHAVNVHAIVSGADPSTFTGAAATFSKDYQKNFGRPPTIISTNAYDAANIILQVIKALIDAGKPVTRESVVQGVLSGKFTGVTGNSIFFDQNGDNIGQRVYTIYQTQQSQDTWDFKAVTQRVA
jgi:serine/threonine-protein kinase